MIRVARCDSYETNTKFYNKKAKTTIKIKLFENAKQNTKIKINLENDEEEQKQEQEGDIFL